MAKRVHLINETKGTSLGKEIILANTFLTRLMGLMGRKHLFAEEGLLLTPSTSIHMFWMKISLDLVFLNKDNQVVEVYSNIHPWEWTPAVKDCWSILEVPVGTIQLSKTQLGDQLVIIMPDSSGMAESADMARVEASHLHLV